MLLSASSREALRACPPSPLCSLSSFTVEFTLFSPCSRSDPPLSRQSDALAYLDSLPPHDLVLWANSSVPLPAGKRPTALIVALRPFSPFRQAKNV